VEYFMTPKGEALAPVMEALKEWGLEYAHKTASLENVA
jgi:DNA-binding HxlR family transcriptional regulator